MTIGSLPAAAGLALAAGGADLLVAGASGSSLTVAALSLANGGQLDPAFGDNEGSTTFGVGTESFQSAGVAVEPDGEVVTGGVGDDGTVVMALLLPGGIPDDRVDPDNFANYRDEPMPSGTTLTSASVATDGQGRILVTAGGMGRLLVARLEPDLTPDVSFGTQSGQWAGTTVVGVTGTFEAAATVQANGSIVIGGYGSGGSVLVRLLPDGTLDTSFGSYGVVNPPAGSGTGLAVATGPDGRAVEVDVAQDGGLQLQRFDTQPADQRLYAEHDADYDITSLTDAAGNVVERYVYDPYGNVTVLNPDWTIRGEGTAADSHYGWAVLHQGLFYDLVTGTYYDRNRTYDPSLGRFLQQDPAGYVDGASRYQSEESSPADEVDPSGLGTAPAQHPEAPALGSGSPAAPTVGVDPGSGLAWALPPLTGFNRLTGNNGFVTYVPTTPLQKLLDLPAPLGGTVSGAVNIPNASAATALSLFGVQNSSSDVLAYSGHPFGVSLSGEVDHGNAGNVFAGMFNGSIGSNNSSSGLFTFSGVGQFNDLPPGTLGANSYFTQLLQGYQQGGFNANFNEVLTNSSAVVTSNLSYNGSGEQANLYTQLVNGKFGASGMYSGTPTSGTNIRAGFVYEGGQPRASVGLSQAIGSIGITNQFALDGHRYSNDLYINLLQNKECLGGVANLRARVEISTFRQSGVSSRNTVPPEVARVEGSIRF